MVRVGGKWTKPPKNVCEFCGGQLVIEYLGSYGYVYELTRTGKPYKTRDRKIVYPVSKDEYMIYCRDCHRTPTTGECAGRIG